MPNMLFSQWYFSPTGKPTSGYLVHPDNDVNTNGIDVASMNKILTKKIEELTLYIIQLNNEIKSLKENQKTK